mgnify:CR=1 FL=1
MQPHRTLPKPARDFTLLVRFLLELGAVAAVSIGGFALADGAAGVVLGIVAPVLVVVTWGAFVAPKAPRRLADPARFAVEVVVFGLAAMGLVVAGQALLGVAFGAFAVANAWLVRVVGES